MLVTLGELAGDIGHRRATSSSRCAQSCNACPQDAALPPCPCCGMEVVEGEREIEGERLLLGTCEEEEEEDQEGEGGREVNPQTQ